MTQLMPEFPGVAKYPIDTWEAMGAPKLTTKGWIEMCMRIAQKNMADLHTVFEVTKKLEPMTAASDASTGVGSGLQCGIAGEPPPSPPLPSASSAASEPGPGWDLL